MCDWQPPCLVPRRPQRPGDEACWLLRTREVLCGGTRVLIQPLICFDEAPSISRTAFPAPSTPALGVSLLASNLTRHGLAPGPLHCLCLLPMILFPRYQHGPRHYFLTSFCFPPSQMLPCLKVQFYPACHRTILCITDYPPRQIIYRFL